MPTLKNTGDCWQADQIMKEDKDAIGGNYKYNHLKVFGSVENFYKDAKTYRRVFDASECRYIYGELSFYNKLFDERDW